MPEVFYEEDEKLMAFCSLEYGIRWHSTNIIFKCPLN